LKVCEEIAEMIKNKGCMKPLDVECIYNKITHIEAKMRQCHDKYAGTKTGNGLKESGPMAYKDKVSECIYNI
jgi:putative IMPACT (imprinted ancient) family translation regulator